MKYNHIQLNNIITTQDLANELKAYILQFVTPSEQSKELIEMIGEDAYKFTLYCKYNFNQ